ncbi:hypothetical protein GQM33_15615 [Escherichia coli]|uniref:hypothetical protein n=1 Tax=Escherichia coli TaxID=562 RepID=UPI00130270E3|nr:hypothetical protein [Escherichia coli]KAE9653668.1 hypothetical protein GP725_15615 [Escherichia coli]MWK71076.1 hypothetical protein [Escherichia coli]
MVELVIAGIAVFLTFVALIWTIIRDNKTDDAEIEARLASVETRLALVEQSVTTLRSEHEAMKITLKSVDESIRRLEVDIARILVILDK